MRSSPRLLRGTAAYAGAAILQRSIAFFLLPIYARALSPAEYGQIGVITTFAAAAGTVFGLGLETAVFRNYVQLRDNPGELRRFISTVGGFALVGPPVLAVLASAGLSRFFAAVFDVDAPSVTLGLVGAALSVSATVVPLAILRAQERLRDYVLLNGIQIVFSVGLTVIFVVVLRWGALGWMLAFALASGILLARGLVILGHRWSTHFDLRYLSISLGFGLPLVPHALAHWGLSVSDRAVLGAFLPSADVGVYYVAYQFGIPINVVAVALSQAVQPLYAEASISAERDHDIAHAATYQVLAAIFLGMAVAALGPPAVRLLLPASYAAGAPFIPWIALGQALFALYFVPINAITVMTGHTRWIWLVTVAAAIANISLNVLLVPRLGAMAAAIDTAVGYALLLVGIYIYMRRVASRRIPLEWGRIGLSAALVVLASAVVLLFSPDNPFMALMFSGAVLALVLAFLAIVGLVVTPPVATRSRLSRRS